MTATIIPIVFDKIESIDCCFKTFKFAVADEIFLLSLTCLSKATLKPTTSAGTIPA